METDELVTVTQADREAAASLAEWLFAEDVSATQIAKVAAQIRSAICDHAPPVQAFARHRLAAIEECAKVARKELALIVSNNAEDGDREFLDGIEHAGECLINAILWEGTAIRAMRGEG